MGELGVGFSISLWTGGKETGLIRGRWSQRRSRPTLIGSGFSESAWWSERTLVHQSLGRRERWRIQEATDFEEEALFSQGVSRVGPRPPPTNQATLSAARPGVHSQRGMWVLLDGHCSSPQFYINSSFTKWPLKWWSIGEKYEWKLRYK